MRSTNFKRINKKENPDFLVTAEIGKIVKMTPEYSAGVCITLITAERKAQDITMTKAEAEIFIKKINTVIKNL